MDHQLPQELTEELESLLLNHLRFYGFRIVKPALALLMQSLPSGKDLSFLPLESGLVRVCHHSTAERWEKQHLMEQAIKAAQQAANLARIEENEDYRAKAKEVGLKTKDLEDFLRLKSLLEME